MVGECRHCRWRCQWLGALHLRWSFGEGRVREEGGDRDSVYQEGFRSWDEAEGFAGVIFGSNVLLGSFRQQVVVWGVVASGVALGGGNGDGSIVVDGCHENGGFPGELLLEKKASQGGRERL